jgi:hypothetical protein
MRSLTRRSLMMTQTPSNKSWWLGCCLPFVGIFWLTVITLTVYLIGGI